MHLSVSQITLIAAGYENLISVFLYVGLLAICIRNIVCRNSYNILCLSVEIRIIIASLRLIFP